MFFNSIDFAIFLPVVFCIYWLIARRGLQYQNLLLLCASYFFYACWDYRFLFLLMFSTLLDYFTGLKMSNTDSKTKKKTWFWLSVCINLGFLGVFKYYNFFIDSFADALHIAGIDASFSSLQVILPVGISFYTFHGLSYVIDIYKGRITAEKNIVDYSLFVSFFPLLVAGPIERATHLLPQLKKPRVFNYDKATDGLRQILWGLFKKVVVADLSAQYANLVFDNAEAYSGSVLIFGAIFFAFQIYCDFSGYSDIALGTARLFGVDLLRNFAFPYFSRDIAEFWRRWHISLSTWFRDYLYIPLGGNKGSKWTVVRNTFIIFLVSGFWHGANWTFILWGLLHATYFLPLLLLKKNRNNLNTVAEGRYLPSLKELLSMIVTFGLTVFAWIFFRAVDVSHAFAFIKNIFTGSLFTIPGIFPVSSYIIIAFFLLIEWLGRNQQYALEKFAMNRPAAFRWSFYYFLAICIFWYSGSDQPFIYFQF